MKRIGPELKMPKLKGSEMKVPPFFSDLYFDLRDRRLLPLVALMLVAIVAAPILLGGGSEEPQPDPVPGAAAGGIAPTSEKTLTVVKAAPGLRNYKKRLGHRSPTNPFRQRFDGAKLDGGQLNEVTTSTSEGDSSPGTGEGTQTVETEASPDTGGATTGGGSEDGDGDGVPDGATLFTYVIDLQITQIRTKADGTVEKGEPTLRKNVKAPAPLPGEKAPVITYLGMGATEPRAPMFLVSPDVTAIYGEGKCISGTGTCQLITLQRGFPVTFVYGANDVRYKVNLVDVTGAPVEPPS